MSKTVSSKAAASKKSKASKAAKKGSKKAAAKAGKGKTSKPLRRGPETEVTEDVLEFIRALDDYKRQKNRPFPTWSEVLEVIKQLGYSR